jgi:hypothetical protein
MSAKWRRCQKCRRVLSSEEFEGDSEVCQADLKKAAAAPKTATDRAFPVTRSTVTARVAAPSQSAPGGLLQLRGRGDHEVRARRARVRALERLAEMHAEDFELLLREERVTEGL